MTIDNHNKKEHHKFWLLSPYYAVILAVIVIATNNAPALDGAARLTAVVFWFLPLIIWTGCKSIIQLNQSTFSFWGKCIFILVWLIPALPIALMSLFGLLLIPETGFSILFK